jgi:hypothetical protein
MDMRTSSSRLALVPSKLRSKLASFAISDMFLQLITHQCLHRLAEERTRDNFQRHY